MSQDPNDFGQGLGNRPAQGPEFTFHPPAQPSAPPPWQMAPPGPPPVQPPTPQPRRTFLVLVVLGIVLALGAALWFFVIREQPVIQPGPEPTPGATGFDGHGELPEQQALDAPAVIDEVAALAGLTCHDEATTEFQVRGCYLHDPGHLVTLRFLIEDGEIEKVTLTVLHNDASTEERAEEMLQVLTPVVETLPLTQAGREQFLQGVASGKSTDGLVTLPWGDDEAWASHHTGAQTSSASVGRKTMVFRPVIPLSDTPEAVLAVLVDRGWSCEEDESSFDCDGPDGGSILGWTSSAGYDEPKLISLSVWFGPRAPDADEPRMLDAYEALAAAGEKGEAMAVGLRLLAEGEKHFFNSDVEFYRGDSYFELEGIRFS